MNRWFVLLGGLLLLASCNRHVLPTAKIEVGSRIMLVELAYEPQTRARGLMYRDSLHADEGMLFVYPEAGPRSFWMKNTRMPLSIAFADTEGVIVQISDMYPLSKKHTRHDGQAQYALEANKGWFQSNGVKVGDKITKIPDVKVR